LTESERKVIEGGIDSLIHNVLDRAGSNPQFGNLPWGIKSYLKQFQEVAGVTLDWRRVLRLFSATSSKTYLKNTIKRVSKRYGTVPGIKVKHKNKLLVALDTSGSTSTNDHSRFFQEVHHIYRQGAEIMIVECDTHIQKQYLYGGQPPAYVSGRGGTNFEAPIIFANETYEPDAIIYFTDGFAAEPRTVPRMPILWVITSGGVPENKGVWPNLPGRKVKMNKTGS
jgi:predicted metal-dependent peptidase